MSAAGDQLDRDSHDGRNCDFFGCLELADWIITDPRAGSWPPSTST